MAADAFAAQLCLRDAWPSIDTQDLAGWQLRVGQGGYNRINSVWPGRFDGGLSVDEAIDRAEAFYKSRNLVPRFQMLDIAEPVGLDAMLDVRGYTRGLDCSDMAKAVSRTPMPSDATVVPDLPVDWLALYSAEQQVQRVAELPHILNRLLPRRGFVVCRRNGVADAVALVSRMGSEVAVDCVLTRPDARRTGAARTVMLAAEAWAAAEGAKRMLLSVVNDNAAALPLYLSLGYRKFAAYHYRFKATAPAAS